MGSVRRTAAMLLASGLLAGGAALGTGPATAMPVSASPSTGPAMTTEAVPMTRIGLHFDRCVHCPVTLVQAVRRPGSGVHVWRSRTRRVRDGLVTFTVPTRRTVGMSIDVMPRWSKSGAHTNVVIRYRGTSIGQRITPKTARHKRFAEGCWAGTKASRVTMRVRLVRFKTEGGYGAGYSPRAWLVSTHAALPPMVRTWRGSIGNQDAFYCDL